MTKVSFKILQAILNAIQNVFQWLKLFKILFPFQKQSHCEWDFLKTNTSMLRGVLYLLAP